MKIIKESPERGAFRKIGLGDLHVAIHPEAMETYKRQERMTNQYG